jgi:hypothetical protein
MFLCFCSAPLQAEAWNTLSPSFNYPFLVAGPSTEAPPRPGARSQTLRLRSWHRRTWPQATWSTCLATCHWFPSDFDHISKCLRMHPSRQGNHWWMSKYLRRRVQSLSTFKDNLHPITRYKAANHGRFGAVGLRHRSQDDKCREAPGKHLSPTMMGTTCSRSTYKGDTPWRALPKETAVAQLCERLNLLAILRWVLP